MMLCPATWPAMHRRNQGTTTVPKPRERIMVDTCSHRQLTLPAGFNCSTDTVCGRSLDVGLTEGQPRKLAWQDAGNISTERE